MENELLRQDEAEADHYSRLADEDHDRKMFDEEKLKLRNQIFEHSHQEESSELSRKYFEFVGLKMSDVNLDNCYKLSEFITNEMLPLLADKSYHMVERLRMCPKIKKDKEGIHLFTSGSYFSKRQAIEFWFEDKIIFCSWASGCNRIPYIKGFIKWCDWMVEKK
jgi:hypothetical protein